MGNAIGVIGGVGPYAGIDLVKKVFDNTIASSDQEHIDLYLTSTPALIGDRTAYLLEGGENPAAGLFSCLDKLALIGSDVIVIPCNTAHAPPIYDEVARRAAKKWPNVLLLNMIAETMKVIKERFPKGAKIGLLATLGTHGVGVYRTHFEGASAFTLIEPARAAGKRFIKPSTTASTASKPSPRPARWHVRWSRPKPSSSLNGELTPSSSAARAAARPP